MDAAARKKLIEQYKDGYRAVTESLAGLSDRDLEARLPGKWSVREIVHHLADSEMVAAARLRIAPLALSFPIPSLRLALPALSITRLSWSVLVNRCSAPTPRSKPSSIAYPVNSTPMRMNQVVGRSSTPKFIAVVGTVAWTKLAWSRASFRVASWEVELAGRHEVGVSRPVLDLIVEQIDEDREEQ